MTPDRPVAAIRRRGLSVDAADLIREAILGGRFAPGEALREVELAGLLDISRGSVREGLGILEAEGLIQRAWHRGTRVIDVTEEDVREVYSVRAALDGLAARTAHAKGAADHAPALSGLVEQMRLALGRNASSVELVEWDLRFHDRIYEIAGNRRLCTAWGAIRSQVQLFQTRRASIGDKDYRDRLIPEHSKIVDLLVNGVAEEVGHEAERHVIDARQSLLGSANSDPASESRELGRQ